MNKEPRIVVVASRRWEPQHLVDDFLENHRWVDDIVLYDDRDRDEDILWCDEQERYTELHRLAGEKGADWVIATAPDERFDIRAQRTIRDAVRRTQQDLYFRFKVLELFEPMKFRIDGQWAKHSQQRMYRWDASQTFKPGKLHHACVPDRRSNTMVRNLPVNIYHLKQIEPENRIARVKAFSNLDPGEKACNWEGYKYLAEDEGMVLQSVAWRERYEPVYKTPYYWRPSAKLLE